MKQQLKAESDQMEIASVLVGMGGTESASQTSGNAKSSSSSKKKPGRKPKQPAQKYPVDPVLIQKVNKPKIYINHSYSDFSRVPPELDYRPVTDIDQMTFSQKVHHILSQKEYERWIAWNPHGRSFKILVPKRLEAAGVLKKYFGHSRYSSLLRQLANYSFKHVSKGPDRNSYYNQHFLRDLPHLLKYMPEVKDVRRQVPDPDNELDFYELSKKSPVPGGSDDAEPSHANKKLRAHILEAPTVAHAPKPAPQAAVPSSAPMAPSVFSHSVDRMSMANPPPAQMPIMANAPLAPMPLAHPPPGFSSSSHAASMARNRELENLAHLLLEPPAKVPRFHTQNMVTSSTSSFADARTRLLQLQREQELLTALLQSRR